MLTHSINIYEIHQQTNNYTTFHFECNVKEKVGEISAHIASITMKNEIHQDKTMMHAILTKYENMHIDFDI